MLAYVFWHTAQEDVDRSEYERVVSDFHDALSKDPPDGFSESFIWRHVTLPWADSNAAVYEDWYVVDDFAAVGALNDAAVSSGRKEPHDKAAGQAAWGTGGLYGLERGEPDAAGSFVYWAAKPEGWSYDRFYETIDAASSSCLWRRQMVLGPAPEFCISSRDQMDIDLPDVLESAPVLIWSSALP